VTTDNLRNVSPCLTIPEVCSADHANHQAGPFSVKATVDFNQ